MPRLAQAAFNYPDNRRTLVREDVRTLLPTFLDKLKRSPLPLPTMIDTAFSLIATPVGIDQLKGLMQAQGITITDAEITLLKQPYIYTLLRDDDMRALLSLQGTELNTELAALWDLVNAAAPDPASGELASQAYEKYRTLLTRSDIAAALPLALQAIKEPDVQAVIQANPSIINVVVADPDVLENFGVFLEPEFNNLLKTDADVKAMLRDPLVQSLLADPDAVDALIKLVAEASPPQPAPQPPFTVDETRRTIPIPEVPESEPEPIVGTPLVGTPIVGSRASVRFQNVEARGPYGPYDPVGTPAGRNVSSLSPPRRRHTPTWETR